MRNTKGGKKRDRKEGGEGIFGELVFYLGGGFAEEMFEAKVQEFFAGGLVEFGGEGYWVKILFGEADKNYEAEEICQQLSKKDAC